MKATAMIFSALVMAALSPVTSVCAEANGVTNRPPWTNPQEYGRPDGYSGGIIVDSSGGRNEANDQPEIREVPMPGRDKGGVFVPDQNPYPAPVNKAGSLIGMKVKNQNNETLGKIKDIVIDLQSGKVAYVVLEKSGRTHGTGANISVPLSAFTPTADGRQLILNANKSQVQTARGFSRNNYPALSDPVHGTFAAREHQKEHIIIVPVPMSPEQLQDLTPDPDQPRATNPDAISGLSSF